MTGERPLDDLAAGLGEHVARWAAARGADPPTMRALRGAAEALTQAVGQGHVCLTLAEIARASAPPISADALRLALQRSTLVGTAAAPGALPFVLDSEDRLYLHRHFDHERRLARRLVQALRVNEGATPAAAAVAQGAPAELDWQAVAAALAARRRLVIVSGGPGTGKTTTVVRLLAGLLAQHPGHRIALAAPTGKAAARLAEAVRRQAATLPTALREALPTQAWTVHRLLGARPRRGAAPGGFVHGAARPLPVDVLVIDEASMLDLALARRLFDAVPADARIVLLGDKDQLAAVESGAVFAELSVDPGLSEACRAALAAATGIPAERIVPPPAAMPGALADSVVWFTRNHRFGADSAIGRLADAVRGGRGDEAADILRGGTGGGLRWIDDADARPSPATTEAMAAGLEPYLAALRRDPRDVAAAFDAFDGFRVLCALRDGPRGVDAVNERLALHARAVLGAAEGRSPAFVGRPVMVLRNDPVLRLANGDIGLTLPGADGAAAVFFADGDGGWRAVAPARLPPHETAFATTVHKAQGSEFGAVLLLLPAQPSRVLSRELVYTAVTRARERVVLAAGAAVLKAAIAAPTRRHSGLQARLREALAEAPPAEPRPAGRPDAR